MDILSSSTFIVSLVAIGVMSGFFLILLSYAYYKMHRADKITKELTRNRWDSYFHGSLNFNRQ